MCLIVVAWRVDPAHPLLVVANRDEFHDRGTERLAVRDVDGVRVACGLDARAGGTWSAVREGGRFAAVTNVRAPGEPEFPRSRGELPLRFVTSAAGAAETAAAWTPGAGGDATGPDLGAYAAVNVLLGDGERLWWVSNRGGHPPAELAPGWHTLSNAALDAPWPKAERARAAVERVAARPGAADWAAPLLGAMADRRRVRRPWRLPRTGIGAAREWQLSSPFVHAPGYGTRSTTVTRVGRDGRVDVVERTFAADGAVAGTTAVGF